MKQNLLNKLWLRVWMIVAVMTTALAGTAAAEEESVDFTAQGYSNQQAITSYTGTNFSVSFDKGTNNNAPKYYTSGTAIRCYGGNSFTVSSTYTITKIIITFGASDGNNTINVDSGNFEDGYQNGTWTGSANSVKFTIGGTSGNRRIGGITVTYTTGSGSSAVATTTVIDASGITNSDVYEGTEAGSLAATVVDADNKAVKDATVTWSGNNDAVATIDEYGNVTLVAAGTVKFTATYAGVTDEYYASSATYEMTVTDSTPFTGGDVTFAAATDLGTSPLTKNGVTFACSNGALNNGSEYRLYKNSETTFSLSDDIIASGYLIKSIAFTCTGSNPASGFADQEGWATDGSNGTWTGAATSVSFTASGAQVRATEIVVTVGQSAALSSIVLSGDYPTTFHVGDTFSHEGIVVTATYEDETTRDVTASAEFTGYDMATAGAQTITVSYSEGEVTATANYDINVNAPATLLSISLSGTYPIEFGQGDAFSSEGIVVTASFDDNTTADVTAEATFTGYDMDVLGEQTVTVSYEGQEATYTITIVEKKGTATNPYTVAQAIAATPASGTSANVYIKGIVSGFFKADIMSDGSNYRYYISDDGTTDNQLLVYKGKGLNNVAFSSADDLQVGDEVVIFGGLTTYSNAPEVAANNYIVSLVRVEKPAAPTFSVAEGTYTVAQSVELSTATEGATIYYTVDGTEPTAESTEYTEAIVVTETTTIKAIAVKDDVASDVATATYTINTTPSIELGDNEINAPAEGTDGVIIVTYNNITEVESEVFFCDADGNKAAYDWVVAEINEIGNLVYIIDANASTEARTAYMKVYALDDNAEDVYSELITINQAGFVAPPAPGEWVETALADLTFADVFVIVGNNGSTYALSNDNGTSKAPAAVEVEAVDNTLSGEIADNIKWILSGNATDGYTFYPYGSYESWLYCTNTNNGVRVGTNDTNNTFTFDGDYLYNTATDRYVGIYNSQDWRCYTTYTGNIADQNVKFYKKLTTSQTVTVSAAGYATLVAAHDLEIPANVEVYAVEIRGEWAHLEPVTAGVPAGEAVVVKADAGEYVFDYATEAVEALTITNDLIAATAPVTVDGSQYILAKPADQEIGFYKATTGFIAPGKAYLQITGEAPVKGFTFKFDDDATAIDEIVNGKLSNGKCYNLAGQRVSKMQRGINIVNGKKILK